MNSDAKTARVETIKSYIGIFASNVASNPLYTLLSSFLLLFYTDYIGLPAAACGGVILASKVMDGISDLIAGHIIDHTRTKRGSARPWILRAGIPLAFCYVILLAVPPIPQIGQLIYLFISYNLVNTVIYTMYACASTALPTYMTADQQKRSTLFVVFILAGTIMVGIVGSSIMKLVIFFGDDQRAWLIAGCILGTITLICTLIAYALCKETVVIDEDKKDNLSFVQGVKIVFTNKYWLIAAGLNFLSILLQTAIVGVGGYYAKYVMNDVELVGILIFLFAIPCIPFLFAVPKMMKRWGKRNVFLVSMTVMLAGQLLMVVVPMHGSVYVSLIVRGIAYTITYSLINGLISDTIEWSEYKSGLRPQAMTMAVTSLSQKFASGIGTALLSFYLTASGFDVDPFSASAVSAINNSFVYIPIIFIVLSIVLIFVYDLDKKYDRVVAENRVRREQKQAEMNR